MKLTKNVNKGLDVSSQSVDEMDNKNSALIKFKEVKGTPFTIVEKEGLNYVMLGKYMLSKGIHSQKEAIKDAKSMTWDRIMQVMGAMIEEFKINKTNE